MHFLCHLLVVGFFLNAAQHDFLLNLQVHLLDVHLKEVLLPPG